MRAASKRILVVEDDGPTSEAMAEILAASGFLVDTAANAERALEKIRHNRYDVAILDLMLPDSDGVLLRQKIHSTSPAHSPRVIFTTGFTDQPTVVEYLRRSGNAFVAKPFRPAELIDAVHSALGDEKPACRIS
jgi:DNA-binding response OmpR family regulator